MVQLLLLLLLLSVSGAQQHPAHQQQQQQQHLQQQQHKQRKPGLNVQSRRQLLGAQQGGRTLILQFTDAAVQAASEVAAASAAVTAAADIAAGTAHAAAVQRGAPPDRVAAAAAVAREAAVLDEVLSGISAQVTAAAASGAGMDIVQRSVYSAVLNGAAISVPSAADVQQLKQQLEASPLVKSVWIAGSKRIPRPPTAPRPPSDDDAIVRAAASTGAAQSATTGSANATGITAVPNYSSGINGQGVLLCILDTGANYKNDLFGSCTQVNAPAGSCKVVTGWDFVGDGYTGSWQGPSPSPDKEPLDCDGHGSMVASTAGTSFGVAPGAALGVYRVFGCDGETTDDIIIAAMDRAVRDGCDIINLSLADDSGYPDSGVYSSVMARIAARGVLVTRAAGNSGGDGPFMADASTAAGGVIAASAGSSNCLENLDQALVASSFSSYGPSPDLAALVPHVAAPGACVPVISKNNRQTDNSGTSFSSPFLAGCLALWLQKKQLDARQGQGAASVDQAAATKALVTTARPIPDANNARFLEPVSHVGSGLVRVDALLSNQLLAEPEYVPLPSGLSGSFTAIITYTWSGAPHAAGSVAYAVRHSPATSLTLADSWFKEVAPMRVYRAAQVSVSPDRLVINTRTRQPVTLRVTFILPDGMNSRGLLYSGLVRLLPVLARNKLPAVSIMYQGYSKPWSSLPLLARPLDTQDFYHSSQLREQANALCYTPNSEPYLKGSLQDTESSIPAVCDAFAATDSDVVQASLATLRDSPACALRISLAPQVPIRRLAVDLLDESRVKLGSLRPLDTSACDSLQPPESVGSYCLGFDGSFTNINGDKERVSVGSTYRLRATVTGPLALADSGTQPPTATVAIRGILEIVA